MDTRPVESVLAEVGKAFRLCRFYPATHPSVRQAMAELSASLSTLAPVGLVELRIGPAGFALGTTPLLARNPPAQEFANLLYAQGHRAMTLQPGVTADEFAALIRSTAGAGARSGAAPGTVPKAPGLPHIALEGMVRKSAAAPRPTHGFAVAAADGPGPTCGARSTGVFRPNALPLDIEAHRLTALLDLATPGGALGSITRLGTVALELSVSRDFATFAETVVALAHWTKSDDAAAAEAARQALAQVVNAGTIAGLTAQVADPRAAAAAKQAALAALGGLGERAVPALFEAYLAAPDEPVRAAYAGALEAVGGAGVRHLATRVASDHVEPIRAAATLLGGTGCPAAVPVLAPLAHHADAGVRRAAIGSLGRLGGGDAGRTVMAALHDGDAGVRREAASSAGRLGDHGFGPILLGRLKDEADEAAGQALIEALGRLREARAVPALAELAREVSGVFQRRPIAVRVAAIRALVRIGTHDALAAVEPYKTDRHPDVRNAVLVPGP
jgi:HEAT repeat protein